MPRKRHVSRNFVKHTTLTKNLVMPRKRHVSRNDRRCSIVLVTVVMPRKRHVSRNKAKVRTANKRDCHASQEACE